MADKKKVKIGKKKRTTPRVADSGKSSTATSSAKHRQAQRHDVPEGGVIRMIDGEVYLSAQASELVPVAQYANVTIGPVQLAWKIGGIDMACLADVDWTADDLELTDEQEAAFDRAANAIRGTLKVIETVVAEDREAVEESVRAHNEREKEEAASKKSRKS